LHKKIHSINGKIFVLSAPSGAGKTTLVKTIKERFPFLKESISCTTRTPRNGEQEGVDYFFLTRKAFQKQKTAGMFAEWAEVHGNYYGTPLEYIKGTIESGKNIICDVDYQGALNIRDKFPNEAVLIFVLPPSMEELESRLRKRATDDEEIVNKRLQNAKKEITHYKHYDFIITNNCVSQAVDLLSSIIKAHVEGSVLHNYQTIKGFM
jgi:guanylate kinase